MTPRGAEGPRNRALGHDLSTFDKSNYDRGRRREFEIGWRLVSLAFFETTFPWPSSVRALLLRAFGAEVGRGLHIKSQVRIHFPWRLTLGSNVWIGQGSTILNFANVELQDNVALAHEVFLAAASHDLSRRSFPYLHAPICIERGAWLASRSFVGPNVRVGSGSVVCACACVVSDVEAGSVVGGVPARRLGSREIRD